MAFFDEPLPLAERAHQLDVITTGGDELAPHSREWAVMVRDALEGPRTGARARRPDVLFGFTGPRPDRHATRTLAGELGVSPRTVARWRTTAGERRQPRGMIRDRLAGLALTRYLSTPPGSSVARRLRAVRRDGLTVTWSGDFAADIYVRGQRARLLRRDKNIFGVRIKPDEAEPFVSAALAGRWRAAAGALEDAFWAGYFRTEEEREGASPVIVHTHTVIVTVE